MEELLKMSIEELEHILAIAPYSEVHQMAYAIKKNDLSHGAMHQIEEGSLYKIFKQQENIAKDIIHSTLTDLEGPSETKMSETIPSPVKKQKKKKGSKTSELKLKKKKSKSKKIKSKPEVQETKSKNSTKKKKKVKKKDQKNKGSKSLIIESSSGLSDFSTWLLSQEGKTELNHLKKSKKKVKSKQKKKVKKDKSVVSEPLADLLASQGHTDEAIDMYQRLSLIFPEKSAFFAAKIEKIQKEK